MLNFEFEQNASGIYVPTADKDESAKQLLLFGGEHEYATRELEKTARPAGNYMPFPDELLKDKNERFATPVDFRGFVDVGALIDELKSYVGEDYLWRGPEDDHHEFWYESIYATRQLFSQNDELARRFRNLPIHILRLPRGLHDFLHTLSLPVEAPTEEAMHYRIESWRIACSLFNSVHQIRKRKFLDNEALGRRATKLMLRDKFKILETEMKAVETLPEEFVFFDAKPIRRVLGAHRIEHVSKGALDSATYRLRYIGNVAANKAVTLPQALKIAA